MSSRSPCATRGPRSGRPPWAASDPQTHSNSLLAVASPDP